MHSFVDFVTVCRSVDSSRASKSDISFTGFRFHRICVGRCTICALTYVSYEAPGLFLASCQLSLDGCRVVIGKGNAAWNEDPLISLYKERVY